MSQTSNAVESFAEASEGLGTLGESVPRVRCQATSGGTPYDIILLFVELFEKNGFKLTELAAGGSIPLVLIYASVFAFFLVTTLNLFTFTVQKLLKKEVIPMKKTLSVASIAHALWAFRIGIAGALPT